MYQQLHEASCQSLRIEHNADMNLIYALIKGYQKLGKFVLVSFCPVYSECDAVAFYTPYIDGVYDTLEECASAETALEEGGECWGGYLKIKYPDGYVEEHVEDIVEQMILDDDLPF